MLILTQDKSVLLNMDHIIRIKNTGAEIIAVCDNREVTVLGEYDEKDRAAQVVLEIAEKYAMYIRAEGGPIYTQPGGYAQPIMFEPPKLYTMPDRRDEKEEKQ